MEFVNKDRDGQASLKDAARARWTECQDRLAHLQIIAEELTGDHTDTESNLRALHARAAAVERERDELYLGLRAVIRAAGGVAEPGVSAYFLCLGAPAEVAALRKERDELRAALAKHEQQEGR